MAPSTPKRKLTRGTWLLVPVVIVWLASSAFSAPAPQTTVHFPERSEQIETVQNAVPVPVEGSAASSLTQSSTPRLPLRTRNFRCKEGSCNVCHYRASEIEGTPGALANGDSAEGRLEGTNVTRGELAEKEVALQLSG
jgi:hypothetical protein